MRPQQRETEPRFENDPNYVEMAIAFIALVPELLLHDPRTFGIRSVPPRGVGAVLAVWLFGLFYTYDNNRPLLILAVATAVLGILAHLCAAFRSQDAAYVHSFYNGRPWLLRLFPMTEDRAKRIEPLLIVLTGWAIHHSNRPLGTLVITAGACYGFRVIQEYLSNRTRTLDLNDAMAEQSLSLAAMKRRRRR